MRPCVPCDALVVSFLQPERLESNPQIMSMRHDANGNNKDTIAEMDRARKYIRVILNELGEKEYYAWIARISNTIDVNDMWEEIGKFARRLLEKVERQEPMSIVDPETKKEEKRELRQSHPHIISMALKKDINDAHTGARSRINQKESIYNLNAFKQAENILTSRASNDKIEMGKDVRERRDNELYDHQQINLFESIMARRIEKISLIDTLTLALTNTLHFALGQRGVNVRDSGFESNQRTHLSHTVALHVISARPMYLGLPETHPAYQTRDVGGRQDLLHIYEDAWQGP